MYPFLQVVLYLLSGLVWLHSLAVEWLLLKVDTVVLAVQVVALLCWLDQVRCVDEVLFVLGVGGHALVPSASVSVRSAVLWGLRAIVIRKLILLFVEVARRVQQMSAVALRVSFDGRWH